MADANDLVRVIKQAAEDANQAGYPVNVMTGTVTGISPLAIMVEQRFSITKAHLIVPRRLTDHGVRISYNGLTQKAGEPEHQHDYGGEMVVTVHNGLKKGDTVVLVRQQGGQKYLVADKVAET